MDLFKFYMRNGNIVKCIGESASDAITRAGFGGGWYFPLDSVQKAFEYWLNSAAKGMIFPDRKSHPEGSCSLDDIPTNYSI